MAQELAAELQRHHGLCLKPEWVAACLEALRAVGDAPPAAGTPLIDAVLSQALCCDLATAGSPSLPQALAGMHKQVLQGRYVLQVDEVVNIAAPARDRYSNTRERCLRLQLTDGTSCVSGIEYRPLPAISWDCPAGCKVLVENVAVRQGVLLLQPENCCVLGGKVEALEAARLRAVAAWNKPPEGRSRTDGPRDATAEARAAAWAPPPAPNAPPAQPAPEQLAAQAQAAHHPPGPPPHRPLQPAGLLQQLAPPPGPQPMAGMLGQGAPVVGRPAQPPPHEQQHVPPALAWGVGPPPGSARDVRSLPTVGQPAAAALHGAVRPDGVRTAPAPAGPPDLRPRHAMLRSPLLDDAPPAPHANGGSLPRQVEPGVMMDGGVPHEHGAPLTATGPGVGLGVQVSGDRSAVLAAQRGAAVAQAVSGREAAHWQPAGLPRGVSRGRQGEQSDVPQVPDGIHGQGSPIRILDSPLGSPAQPPAGEAGEGAPGEDAGGHSGQWLPDRAVLGVRMAAVQAASEAALPGTSNQLSDPPQQQHPITIDLCGDDDGDEEMGHDDQHMSGEVLGQASDVLPRQQTPLYRNQSGSVPVPAPNSVSSLSVGPDAAVWSDTSLRHLHHVLPAIQGSGPALDALGLQGGRVQVLATFHSSAGDVATIEDGTGMCTVQLGPAVRDALYQGYTVPELLECLEEETRRADAERVLSQGEQLLRSFHGLMLLQLSAAPRRAVGREGRAAGGGQPGPMDDDVQPVLVALKPLETDEDWDDALERLLP